MLTGIKMPLKISFRALLQVWYNRTAKAINNSCNGDKK
jgi:hypothetical protein